MTRVALCVLNWNGGDMVAATIATLLRNTAYEPVEFWLGDNGSTDGSADRIERDFPRVRVERFASNLGYPAGINRLFALTDAPFVAQVNSDVLVRRGWLTALVRCLDENPRCGLAGGRVLLPSGATQFCGSVYSPTRMATRDWLYDPGEVRAPVGYHGPVFLARRQAWDEAGGFNEIYSPGYGEDAELGVDLRRRGWSVLFEPECVVTHLVSRTASKLGRRRLMALAEHHRLLFVARNYPASWLAVHAMLEPCKLALAAARGYLGSYLSAWRELLRDRSSIRDRRIEMRNPGSRAAFLKPGRPEPTPRRGSTSRPGDEPSTPLVLYVNPVAELSGAPRGLVGLVEGLRERGEFRACVAVPDDGWMVERLRELSVPVHYCPHPKMHWEKYRRFKALFLVDTLAAAWRFRRLCRQIRPAIVHVNTSVSLFAALGARWAGVPCVVHYREAAGSGLDHRIIGLAHRATATRLVACSRFVAETIPFGPGKAEVFYDGYSTNPEAPAVERNTRGLVAALRLTRDKGILNVLRAFNLVRQRASAPVELHVVGDFDARDHEFRREVLAYADEHNPGGAVRWHGWQPTPEIHFAGNLVLLHLPDVREGLGLVIGEAALQGTPTVAFRNGGIPEMIEDGRTGFLVDQGDIEAAAERCLSLLENPERALAMGAAARDMVRERFSAQAATARLEGIYRTVMRRPL